jgi:CheY-like chemotaxis protein/HPt (histidine-containing phosphotransfer) domain-containing protein
MATIFAPMPRPPARHLSVLVAEGSAGAHGSALALLRRLGTAPTAAVDGEAAVRDAVGGAYDVVVLGLRLPVMGGVEAMESIRALLPPERQPRVVALAAEAGTRAQLLAAGFDAVCAAPVTAEALSDALADALGRSAGGPASGPDAGALDAQVRAHVADLIGEDDPEFAAELVATFAETTRASLDAARAALRAGDGDAVGAAAHQLRGSASNVGLVGLVDVWAAVEEGVRGGAGLDAAPAGRALAETERALALLAGGLARAA